MILPFAVNVRFTVPRVTRDARIVHALSVEGAAAAPSRRIPGVIPGPGGVVCDFFSFLLYRKLMWRPQGPREALAHNLTLGEIAV